MLKKQIMFDGDKKRFYVGNNEYIVLKSGTVLNPDHKVAKMFPSYCVDIYVDDEPKEVKKEIEESSQLLVEDPIEEASVESSNDSEEQTEDDEDIESKIDSFKTKAGLDEFAASFGIELDRRKSLKNMKKEFLSKI